MDRAIQTAWLDIVEAPTLCRFIGRRFPGYCSARCRCVMEDLANRREAGDPVFAIWVNPDENKLLGHRQTTTP